MTSVKTKKDNTVAVPGNARVSLKEDDYGKLMALAESHYMTPGEYIKWLIRKTYKEANS